MGGGGVVITLGASSWCSGDDVVKSLTDLFGQDPNNQQYIDAKNASLDDFQAAATSGRWQDLLAAYNNAYSAAGLSPCPGWSLYLKALGTLSPTPGSNGANVATISSTTTPGKVL